MHENLAGLEAALGIRFENGSLLRQAFTHASYLNEHKLDAQSDNERLEFLGDAVLELAISEYLFKRYRHLPEGELTKMRAAIVCEASLVHFARKLKFGKYVRLGKGEERTGGRKRPAMLADVFESFVGALYLDAGLEQVYRFLNEHVYPLLNETESPRFADYKTELQEMLQQSGDVALEYRIVDTRGPAHDRRFVAEVYDAGNRLGTGAGRSKKEAEQQAAAQALAALGSPAHNDARQE